MISLNSQIDLLTRLASVPLDPLVEALRQIHVGDPAGSDHLRTLAAPARLWPSRAEATGPDTPARTIALGRDTDYEAARRHFADHGRRLREQAILAERLLEGFVRRQSTAPPTSLQHELAVTGARGSVASASFVVVNRDDTPIDVRFDVSDSRRDVDVAAVARSISFDPPTPRLLRGEEAVVRLSLSLRGYEGQHDVIEIGVDVRSEDRLLVRLWIRVRVTEQETKDAEPVE